MTGQSQIPQEFRERLRLVPGINGHQAHRRTLTDLGNAERFVDEHGQDGRFCHPWGKWLVYDGARWIPDDEGLVAGMMKQTVRNIYREAAEAAGEKARKEIADHAKRSEAKSRIIDALYLARSEAGIPVAPPELDADPWLLNCQNGTVDLRTGDLREHRREDLITKLAPVEYDPEAEAPVFAAFLERILPSEALRRFVQRVVGYATTGTVSEEVLTIFHGAGANGKSTLVNAVMEALGDYAMQAAPDLLLVKRGAHPTELADLFGARFVASVEVEDGRRIAESLVKQLTGRDKIKARRMREDFWQFDPTHTVFLATNHRPEVRGTDHAIWRRIRLVPFDVTIPKADQDRRLPEKLRAELAGVLTWIVRGCLEWQREGLGEPEEVTAATDSYRADMDVLAAFIEERCAIHEDATAAAAALYSAYKDWCEENGETGVSQRRFGLQLRERGFQTFKYTGGPYKRRKGWRGVGLAADGGDDPPTGGDGGPYAAQGPPAESGLDKPDTAKQADEGGPRGPQIDINAPDPLREGTISKSGPQGPQGPPPPEGTPRTGSTRRLTDEEAEKVKRLVGEGMSAKFARETVLGEAGEQ